MPFPPNLCFVESFAERKMALSNLCNQKGEKDRESKCHIFKVLSKDSVAHKRFSEIYWSSENLHWWRSWKNGLVQLLQSWEEEKKLDENIISFLSLADKIEEKLIWALYLQLSVKKTQLNEQNLNAVKEKNLLFTMSRQKTLKSVRQWMTLPLMWWPNTNIGFPLKLKHGESKWQKFPRHRVNIEF